METTIETCGATAATAVAVAAAGSAAVPPVMVPAVSGPASVWEEGRPEVLAERTEIGAVRLLRGTAEVGSGLVATASVTGAGATGSVSRGWSGSSVCSVSASSSAWLEAAEVLGTAALRTVRALRTERAPGESAEPALDAESDAELDVELPPSSASATWGPATADPIPNATARTPTRPICFAYPIILFASTAV
ncbi:hypothetical protein CRI78_27835 [Mycolicibacterium diernhoferi]|uniref:Uncharacterized protein n=1 Tax=Mycolicibacterium diernhoferi TaxID=1801 RepID=A0A2A7NLA9_9MYCO|nr:hypothetical protein CRI78_27835 [Mycolicibacterium diernhoferi]